MGAVIKSNRLGIDLLKFELTARKIKQETTFSKNAVRIGNSDYAKVRHILSKIKSPRKLKYEISQY
jgi:hypothetical protein